MVQRAMSRYFSDFSDFLVILIKFSVFPQFFLQKYPYQEKVDKDDISWFPIEKASCLCEEEPLQKEDQLKDVITKMCSQMDQVIETSEKTLYKLIQ